MLAGAGLLKARVDAKVVADLLGHASVAITLDIYAHVLPDMLRDAVAAITATLETAGGSERVVAPGLAPGAARCPHCGQVISGPVLYAPSDGGQGLMEREEEQSGEQSILGTAE